jgi:hypothetical protein
MRERSKERTRKRKRKSHSQKTQHINYNEKNVTRKE